MHGPMNIKSLVTSACFEHHAFINRKAICACSFFNGMYIYGIPQKHTIYKLHVQMAFLMMNA